MPRVETGLIEISGKWDDKVITSKGKYGKIIRKTVRPGSKKHEEGLKKQYTRTPFINKLASEINNAIHDIAGAYKPGDFYARLLSQFRKEPLNHRLAMLNRVKGINVRPKAPMRHFAPTIVQCTIDLKKLNVVLGVGSEPVSKQYFNCYSFEISVIIWPQKKGDEPDLQTQYSEWISINDKLPLFKFHFPKPKGAAQWLLITRIRLGSCEQPIIGFAGEAIELSAVGSFDKREQMWLQTLQNSKEEMPREFYGRNVKEVMRVKRIS